MITQLSGQTLLVFVGIPVLVIAVVALLVNASSIATGPRYRPGLSWWAPPVWIGGPSAEPAEAGTPQVTAGEPVTTTATATAGTGVARTTGGASASW
ncbi:MAG TPA: hypothetical protein VFT31_16960 [Kribbella sp.]|nr:hypothetical protein [Kribbella sp.]